MVYAYAFNPGSRQQAFVEYVEEATYGSGIPAQVANTPGPGAPMMMWFGAVTNFDDQSKNKTSSKPYLAPASVTSRTSAVKNAKTGEEVGFNMDFMVQQGSVLSSMCYPLGTNAAGVTATTGAVSLNISDTLKSIAVGQAFTVGNWDDAKRFVEFTGLACEEYTLTIPEEGEVMAKTKWVGTGKIPGADWVDTSVTPKGLHAVDPCTPVLNSQAVSDMKLRFSTTATHTAAAWGDVPEVRDAISAIEFKITNKLGLPKDLNLDPTTNVTRVKACVLLSRKMTLGLDMTYADITGDDETDAITYESIHSFTPFDFQFKFDGYQYEFSRVRFPELPYKAGGEDLIGDKLTSLPIGEICSGTDALVITKVA